MDLFKFICLCLCVFICFGLFLCVALFVCVYFLFFCVFAGLDGNGSSGISIDGVGTAVVV